MKPLPNFPVPQALKGVWIVTNFAGYSNSQLSAIAASLSAVGPARVMIDNIEAVPYKRAVEEYHITPNTILVRVDGWSLGFDSKQISTHNVQALWAGDWALRLVYEPDADWGATPTEVPVPAADVDAALDTFMDELLDLAEK
jgi:hypothetical protein